jgi:Ca2+/Na+ antiporter
VLAVFSQGNAMLYRISMISILGITVYGLSVFFMKTFKNEDSIATIKSERQVGNTIVSKYFHFLSNSTLKQSVLQFIFFPCILIVCSFFLSPVSNSIQKTLFNGNDTFISSLMMSIVSSSSEIIIMVTLLKLHDYNAALSDMSGSSLTNCTIASIVQICYGDNFYSLNGNKDAKYLTLFCLGALLLMTISLFV